MHTHTHTHPHITDIQVGQVLGHGEFGEVVELLQLHASKACDDCQACQAPTHKHRCRAAFNPTESEEEDDDDDDDQTQVTEHLSSDDDDFLQPSVLLDEEDNNHNNQRLLAAARLAHHVATTNPNNGTTKQYVVKRVKQNVKVALVDDAIADLTCEAMFLARLCLLHHHDNIITLCATVGKPGTASFMLVLDRLSHDLSRQIKQWQTTWCQCRGKALGLWQRNVVGLQALYVERLLAAIDIAQALRHLHGHKILYRDVKVSVLVALLSGRMKQALLFLKKD